MKTDLDKDFIEINKLYNEEKTQVTQLKEKSKGLSEIIEEMERDKEKIIIELKNTVEEKKVLQQEIQKFS